MEINSNGILLTATLNGTQFWSINLTQVTRIAKGSNREVRLFLAQNESTDGTGSFVDILLPATLNGVAFAADAAGRAEFETVLNTLVAAASAGGGSGVESSGDILLDRTEGRNYGTTEGQVTPLTSPFTIDMAGAVVNGSASILYEAVLDPLRDVTQFAIKNGDHTPGALEEIIISVQSNGLLNISIAPVGLLNDPNETTEPVLLNFASLVGAIQNPIGTVKFDPATGNAGSWANGGPATIQITGENEVTYIYGPDTSSHAIGVVDDDYPGIVSASLLQARFWLDAFATGNVHLVYKKVGAAAQATEEQNAIAATWQTGDSGALRFIPVQADPTKCTINVVQNGAVIYTGSDEFDFPLNVVAFCIANSDSGFEEITLDNPDNSQASPL